MPTPLVPLPWRGFCWLKRHATHIILNYVTLPRHSNHVTLSVVEGCPHYNKDIPRLRYFAFGSCRA